LKTHKIDKDSKEVIFFGVNEDVRVPFDEVYTVLKKIAKSHYA